MPAMAKKPPKLNPDATPDAKAVHAFLVKSGMTMADWVDKAGLSPNVLGNLFAGRTQGLQYTTVKKLADAAGTTPVAILGETSVSAILAGEAVPLSAVRRSVQFWAASRGRPDPERDAKDIEAIIVLSLEGDGHTPA